MPDSPDLPALARDLEQLGLAPNTRPHASGGHAIILGGSELAAELVARFEAAFGRKPRWYQLTRRRGGRLVLRLGPTGR